MLALPIVMSITVHFIRIVSTVISVITEASRIYARSSRATMLSYPAICYNWRQRAVCKADIINGNISKYAVPSLSLKNNLEWRCMTPHI